MCIDTECSRFKRLYNLSVFFYISYSTVGGLSDQIGELRESIELPLMNPELFLRFGIKPPKGVLLYGPPGTGKTLLARAIASNIDANFLKVVSSAIIDKYIGESTRLIREMFGYARDHQIDAIVGCRFSEGTSADREIQRMLMELLNQLDGFDQLGKVCRDPRWGRCYESYSEDPKIVEAIYGNVYYSIFFGEQCSKYSHASRSIAIFMRLEAPKDLNSSFVSPVILQPFTSVPMNENATHAPDNITIPRFMNSDYSEAHSVTSEMSHLAYTDPLLGEMSIIENMNEDAFIDPLPIEMERIEKEKEEAFKIHEQKILQLQSDYEKEVEK
ncbi:hypothetical protein JHK82_031612 [Glycine max]|nr:hypothetical protein JHK85_032265 [Glycine max]KAG5124875.1 hypothetical protein JHK82_031612 [Glycine max]